MQLLLEKRKTALARKITVFTSKEATPRSAPRTWSSHPQARAFLTVLSRDASLSRSVRVFVDKDLRIGRKDAKVLQDLELDGIGIAAETCHLWAVPESKVYSGDEKNSPYLFEVSASSKDSIVFVNGKALNFESSYNTSPNPDEPPRPGVVRIKHNDRLALGHCAHIFLVVAPPAHRPKIQVTSKGQYLPQQQKGKSLRPFNFFFKPSQSSTTAEPSLNENVSEPSIITYEQCVLEVMLRRQESNSEKQQRLAQWVLQKWRLPAARASHLRLDCPPTSPRRDADRVIRNGQLSSTAAEGLVCSRTDGRRAHCIARRASAHRIASTARHQP